MSKTPKQIHQEMAQDRDFLQHLECVNSWPDHMYHFRPTGLKDALFMLAEIGEGKPLPDEMKLRKACAVVYADHLRLENKYFYAQEAKAKERKRIINSVRTRHISRILPPRAISPTI